MGWDSRRWLVHSIATYYDLRTWSVTVGDPARREAMSGSNVLLRIPWTRRVLLVVRARTMCLVLLRVRMAWLGRRLFCLDLCGAWFKYLGFNERVPRS